MSYVVMWCVYLYVRLEARWHWLVKRSNKIAVIRIIGTSHPYNVGQIRYAVKQYVPIAYIIVYKWQQTGSCCHRPSVRVGKMKGKVTDILWNGIYSVLAN
jgi:hypothetical protein